MQFVRNLLHDEEERQVVQAIIGVARKFDIRTIAEGVEDQPTLEELQRDRREHPGHAAHRRPRRAEHAGSVGDLTGAHHNSVPRPPYELAITVDSLPI
jgi:predicted signal transduction protein with EAL and GGDEF domain